MLSCAAGFVVAFAVTAALLSLLFLSDRHDKRQVLWWRLGHGLTQTIF